MYFAFLFYGKFLFIYLFIHLFIYLFLILQALNRYFHIDILVILDIIWIKKKKYRHLVNYSLI